MTNNNPIFTFWDAEIIPARELQPGDTFHHWSPRGGTWTVRAILADGRIRCTSDLGAVRNFRPEMMDGKRVHLRQRGAD